MARTEASSTNGNTNGHAYIPQQGRPPRKEREPVRTGLTQSLRSLKEINQNWSSAVTIDKESGHAVLVSRDAAKLCGDQIKFLAQKLGGLTAEIEKRLVEA